MSNEKIPYKIYLEENELPKQWYNVRADMKKNSNSCLCISESLRQVRADMQFRANGLPRAS